MHACYGSGSDNRSTGSEEDPKMVDVSYDVVELVNLDGGRGLDSLDLLDSCLSMGIFIYLWPYLGPFDTCEPMTEVIVGSGGPCSRG